jgi:hypothetical protein
MKGFTNVHVNSFDGKNWEDNAAKLAPLEAR